MQAHRAGAEPALMITADDYGLAPAYDQGILEAARAGAVDAVGVMVMREPDARSLIATGVEIGLHLDPPEIVAPERQLAEFELAFGSPPAQIDGHHHCHAAARGPALAVAKLARERGIPVRLVSPRHRRLLRCQGVATADRLLGRLVEREAALAPELERWLAGQAPSGVSEWMVHPGRPDPSTGSSYDRGRGEDLALVLSLGDRESWRARGVRRAGPRELLASSPAAARR